MSVNLGSAKAYLELDIKNFKSAWAEAEAASKSYSNSLTSNVTSTMAKTGTGLTSAGTKLTKTVTVPVVAAGTAIIKTSADFESGMSKVSAISGATGEDLESLRQKAIEMGAKTKFSASESADAFTYMAMAGWKTKEMLEGIDGIMALSAADGLDLATTSDIVTDGLTAFGLSAKDANHFADVLAQGSRNANLNVSMLGEAFKYVGPVAGSLGYSIEDVTKALGLMANVGIKSSQAGTSLRQALSSLINPTDDAAALMEKYGISLFDGQGNAKDLMTVMKDLRGTFGKVNVDIDKATEAAEAGDEAWAEYAKSLPMSEQEKLSSLTEIFGVRSMPAMLAIINTAEDDFNSLSDAIDNSNGTAQEMSDTMLNNLSGQITIIKSALEGFAISIGDILLPYMKKFAERIQGVIDWLNGLDEAQKKNLVKIAGIAAAIGPALIVIGKLLTTGSKLINGFKTLQAIMPAIKSGLTLLEGGFASVGAPIIAIVSVITILVAAFKHLWDTNEGFRERVTAIWEGIKEKFESFTKGIADRLNTLGFSFKDITEVIKSIWDAFCNFLAPIFEGVFQQVSNIFTFVTDTILSVLDIFVGIFTGDWDQVWEGVKGVFESVWTFISDTFNNVIDTILGIFGTTREEISTKWTELWQNVKNWFEQKWNEMLTFFSELPYKIGHWLGEMLGKAITWAKEFPGKAKTAATDFFDNLKEWFTELPEKLKSWLDDTIAKAKQFATDFPKKAKEAGEDFRDTLKTKLEELPGKMLSIGKNIVEGIWNGINNAKQWLIDKISSFASGFTDGLKDSLGIHSPSKVMANEVGIFIPQGIGQGFEKSMPATIKEMNKSLTKDLLKLRDNEVEIPIDTEFDTGKIIKFEAAYEKMRNNINSSKLAVNFDDNVISSFDTISDKVKYLKQNALVLHTNESDVDYVGYSGFSQAPQSKTDNQVQPQGSTNNTFNFYSPKAIDPIEASRQMKKVERELTEGF